MFPLIFSPDILRDQTGLRQKQSIPPSLLSSPSLGSHYPGWNDSSKSCYSHGDAATQSQTVTNRSGRHRLRHSPSELMSDVAAIPNVPPPNTTHTCRTRPERLCDTYQRDKVGIDGISCVCLLASLRFCSRCSFITHNTTKLLHTNISVIITALEVVKNQTSTELNSPRDFFKSYCILNRAH